MSVCTVFTSIDGDTTGHKAQVRITNKSGSVLYDGESYKKKRCLSTLSLSLSLCLCCLVVVPFLMLLLLFQLSRRTKRKKKQPFFIHPSSPQVTRVTWNERTKEKKASVEGNKEVVAVLKSTERNVRSRPTTCSAKKKENVPREE